MIDPIIASYLEERKDLWLKPKIKKDTAIDEEQRLKEEAEEKFSFEVWVIDAARRAKQLSLVSHPSKFSHPSAKTTTIIAEAKSNPDGLLRTGNVDAELDVLGNAAALDVYKFLSLSLQDGRTVLQHLEGQSEYIQKQFSGFPQSYSEIAHNLLAIKDSNKKDLATSDKVKQVYFPIDDENHYHLLSVMTPSSLMFELKNRIREMHFSDSTKEARADKKSNTHREIGYSEIYNLSVIGYGGTKPQNISVLNSHNHGAAYLLSSVPPVLAARKIFPPKTSFFTDSLRAQWFAKEFEQFHHTLVVDPNNMYVRQKRDRYIRSIIHQVIDRLWLIRTLESNWSESDDYNGLPQYQKIWLDQKFRESRESDNSWLDPVKLGIARWFEHAYASTLGAKAITLGDDLISHVEGILSEYEEGLI